MQQATEQSHFGSCHHPPPVHEILTRPCAWHQKLCRYHNRLHIHFHLLLCRPLVDEVLSLPFLAVMVERSLEVEVVEGVTGRRVA